MKKLFLKLFIVLTAASIILTPHINFNVKAAETFEISAKASYMMDYESGTEIYAKNEFSRLSIASMTKLMLLNLCYENYDNGVFKFDDDIIVSERASGMGGSQVFLDANKSYKAKDLLKSIIIASANDASVAMAETLYGSEEECVAAMNKRAADYGLTDTLFSNCTGLPKPTQYSCAKDVAIMLYKLISHKEYFEFSHIWMDKITHSDGRETGLTNTNKLVRFFEGCDGGKTGFTSESGFCLACTAKRGNMRLISVVINEPDSKTRFSDVSGMLNFGFNTYTNKTAVDSSRPMEIRVKVNNGKSDSIEVIPENDLYIFSKKNLKENITMDFQPFEKVKAPINKGDKVGEIIIYRDNVEYGRVNVIANETVAKKIYFDYIKDIAKNW